MEYRESIIGRHREQEMLQKCLESNKAELIAVYGRRRVGKTYLVKEFFYNKFDFYISGVYHISKKTQLNNFARQIASYTGKKKPKINDWFDAFDSLKAYLSTIKKEKIVVFIDELPWFDTAKSNFIRAFEAFWNMWGSSQKNLKLIVCGSATTWMLNKLIGDKGGLHNRVTRRVPLYPFNLNETEEYLKHNGCDWDRLQVLQCYMALGGIPYYLEKIDSEKSILQNIDRLFFTLGGELRDEYDYLYRSLFNDAKMYVKVVELVASKLKGLTRKEIVTGLDTTDNQTLTTVLENLCRCGFLRAYHSFGSKKKGTLYQLSDMYSLFYIRFVKDHYMPKTNEWLLMKDQKRDSWYGYSFEQVCLHHVDQIKQALGISGIESDVSSWSYTPKDDEEEKGGQIDLVIDRDDHKINLCEMKYSSLPYEIKSTYAESMRERKELFRRRTRTNKTLNLTIVSPYGIKPGKNTSDIVGVITLDDLFRPE